MPTDLPRTDTDPSPAPPASHEHDDLFAALRTRARHRKRARHPLVTFAASAGTVIAFGALLIAVPIALRKPATGTYSPLVTVRERVPSAISPAIAVPPPRTTDAPESRESTETNAAGSTDEQEEASATTVATTPPVEKPAASDKPRPPVASAGAAAEKSGAAPSRAVATPAAAAPTVSNVQPAEKLAEIRSGDSKERIFDLFATVFVKQGGKVEQIDGIRLRVSSRPAPNRLVEVGEVVVGERGSNGVPYWFLFEEGRLLAWGKPEQWDAAALRYQIELDYAPRRTAEARSR
jgi:hypothetical protein